MNWNFSGVNAREKRKFTKIKKPPNWEASVSSTIYVIEHAKMGLHRPDLRLPGRRK